MIGSKLLFNFLKLCFLVVLAGNITSCVKAQKQVAPGTSSQRVFRFSRDGKTLVDLSGYATDQIASQNISYTRAANTGVISEQARYADKREYNLAMCGLSDVRAPGNPLMGQKFEIFSELPVSALPDGGTVATVRNDNCLYWTVNFQFDPFASSVNLYVNFIFRAVSGAKTFIHRTVLINPWDKQRGPNDEFFDFTRFGLSPATQQMPLAVGPEEIFQALNGTFKEGNRQLQIGSVQFVPVKKDVLQSSSLNPQVVYTLPDGNPQAREYVSGTNIGDMTNEVFKRIHELRAAALGESSNPDVQNLQTIDLNLNIRLADLKVRLPDASGAVNPNSDMPLPTGRYKIQAQLVASDLEENGKYYIISSRIPFNGCDIPKESPRQSGEPPADCLKLQASAGSLWNTETMGVNAVIPLTLVARPMWGNLQIVLKVEPIDIKLKPFEAVYYLGTFESIGHAAGPLFDLANFNKDDKGQLGFSFDNYLAGAYNYDTWVRGRPEEGINSDSIERGFRRFRFTHLDVLFSRVVPGDTSTDRTIQYTVKTCLQETAMGVRPQAGRKFDITTDDRRIPIHYEGVKTDDQGCLSWVGLISHKFYQRERLIEKTSVLTYKNENGQSQSQVLKYYINPWDEKFTFGRDARVLPEDYIKQINDGQKFAPPTRILVTDFHYDAIGFRYVVDKYMNLTVKKTVLLNIKPKVLKYNSIIWGRSGFADIRDGIYLLKVAMQKDYLDPAAPGRRIEVDSQGNYTIPYNSQDTKTRRVFITIKEVLVRVLGGAIVTPIEFDINDLRTLRLRSQMFIQLETIDEMLLRAVMSADNRLTQRMNNATELTVAIRDRQMEDDKLGDEITRLMAQARAAADQKEIQEKIEELQRSRSDNYARLRELMSGVDYTVAQQLFADIERIGRDGGQTEESVQGSIRRIALNKYLEVMKKVIREYQSQSGNQDYVRTREVQESYANTRRQECEILRNRLIADGDHVTAGRYSPDAPNSLCPLTIPADQMFYYLATREDLGSERWLSEILTPEELNVLKNSVFPGHSGDINNEIINVLRDDFTEAYRPDYDFDLLSNQGDEMAAGADPEYVSGLARRTFMGPVTFVLNGNGSAVRPTDVLDEASCGRTCEQLADIELDQVVASDAVQSTIDVVNNYGNDVNEAYEKNPYFGYVGQFYKKQVNDLIPMYRGVLQIYKQEMEAFSKDGYFVDSMRLTHVRLSHPDPESLKTMDPVCYGQWKADIEQLYEQWRVLKDDTTKITFTVPDIPANCFRQTRNVLPPNQFLAKVNGEVPPPHRRMGKRTDGIDPNFFIHPTNTYDYTAHPVSAEELKEFAKNGVRSVRLTFESKEKILHHMCYITRETMAPQGSTLVQQIFRNSLAKQEAIDQRGFQGSMFAQFLRERFDITEDTCHKAVNSYIAGIRSVGRMTPQNQAILMADQAKVLPFVVERRVRVLDTTHRYIYQDGKTLNYSVSKSFGIDGGFRTNRGRKFEFDGDKVAGIAGGAIAGAAITAWAGPGAAIGAIAGGIVGGVIGVGTGFVGYNMEWTEGEGISTSNGTGVSSGTTLAAQISTLDIELARFEKCIVIRPSPQFLVETKYTIEEANDWINNNHASEFPSYNFISDINKVGYFVCSGDIETEDDLHAGNPLRVREHYYYFTQIFNDGDMQDPGELVNHPWMLMLRGERDFAVFEQALMVPPEQLRWGEARDQMTNDVGDFISRSSTSNNRMSQNLFHNMPSFNTPGDFEVVNPADINMALDMMQRGFERALPAVPGMYTFSDFESDSVISWPADQSSVRSRIATPRSQPAAQPVSRPRSRAQ